MSYLQERIQCPNCPPFKSPSLSINRSNGVYHCFRCGISGKDKNKARSFRILLAKAQIEWPEEYSPIRPDSPRNLGERAALHYLHERGVTDEQVNLFKIGFCSKGLYENRIIVPIFKGVELVYFVARAISKAESRKYLNPSVPKEGILFKTFIGKAHRAAVVEGVFDAIAVSTFLPAIAMLSKNPTEEQIKSICDSAEELVLMLDSDAHKTALEVGERLSFHVPVRRIRLEQGDPANLNKEKLCEIIRSTEHPQRGPNLEVPGLS